MNLKNIARNIMPYGLIVMRQKKMQDRISAVMDGYPDLFNDEGNRVYPCYLQDDLFKHIPYSSISGRYPKQILWDRFNYQVGPQFYTNNQLLQLKPCMGNNRFAWLLESETILPESYKAFENKKGLENDFTAIFTYKDSYLNEYSNALFAPAGGVIFGTREGGGCLKEDAYQYKIKNISMISSNKRMCDMHNYRIGLARHFQNGPDVDTFGNYDGGSRVKKISEVLVDYRYNIAVENDITDYYFTEKILNCFASMTIPIYIGARKIGDFFNMNGIIQVEKLDFEHIDNIVKTCCEEDYYERLDAVIDNFKRVQKFLTVEDWIFNNYSNIILKK